MCPGAARQSALRNQQSAIAPWELALFQTRGPDCGDAVGRCPGRVKLDDSLLGPSRLTLETSHLRLLSNWLCFARRVLRSRQRPYSAWPSENL
jgi:hypothetical protein